MFLNLVRLKNQRIYEYMDIHYYVKNKNGVEGSFSDFSFTVINSDKYDPFQNIYKIYSGCYVCYS